MTPKELIDAIKGCDKVIFKLTGVGEREYDTSELIYIVEALRFQQELVRCKDCIHQYKDERLNGLYCALMSTVNIKIIADNDEYCSAGERRDEE